MLIGHSMADGSGLLLAVDPQICEIMQREERELIGMPFAALTHPDDRAHNLAMLEKLGFHDGPLLIRKRYVRPDGSSIWSNVRVSKLKGGDGGRLVGTLEVVDPNQLKRGPESFWRSANQMCALIDRRRTELGEDFFADHGWTILLQVYLAEAEGRAIDLADLGERVALRPTLVGRWVAMLQQKKLIELDAWSDHTPQLTSRGVAKVESVLAWTVNCTA